MRLVFVLSFMYNFVIYIVKNNLQNHIKIIYKYIGNI